MYVTDLRSLIELAKDVLPFIVCIFTFIMALFLYKVALKTNRRNPLIYVLSFVSVLALYFAFIDVVGLNRYDYFLCGLRLFLDKFKGLCLYSIALFIAIMSLVKSIDLPILIITIHSLASILSIFVSNIDYLFLKAKYICALVFNFKFVCFEQIKHFFGYNCLAVNDIHVLNCVYNC